MSLNWRSVSTSCDLSQPNFPKPSSGSVEITIVPAVRSTPSRPNPTPTSGKGYGIEVGIGPPWKNGFSQNQL